MTPEYSNKQKGFIQMPILIAIVFGVVVIGGCGITYIEYRDVTNKIIQSDTFVNQEKYTEADQSLNDAQESWLVNSFGIKKQLIEDKLQEISIRKQHYNIFNQALEEKTQGNFQKAIELFSKIPEDSFYVKDVKLKIEELKSGILEEKLGVEQAARVSAESKARQEEVARKDAEQNAQNERLAKEEQQRETVAQQQRTKQEEKEKYIELSRTNPLIKALINGEIKFYVEPLPSYAAPSVSSDIDKLADAFALLKPYDLVSIRRVYDEEGSDLVVSWVRDYGSHTLGEAIFRSHVKVGLGTTNCLGEWMAFDSPTISTIFLHELGHSLGFGHSNDSNNIMYSTLATRFEVEQEVSEVIAGGWYFVLPFCSAGDYYYSFEVAETYGGFNIFVLPPGQDAKQISGGSGQYYPDCSGEGMRSFSRRCSVPKGATIYIGNTSLNAAIRLKGKIIDIDLPPTLNAQWDKNAFQYNSDELSKIWHLFH